MATKKRTGINLPTSDEIEIDQVTGELTALVDGLRGKLRTATAALQGLRVLDERQPDVDDVVAAIEDRQAADPAKRGSFARGSLVIAQGATDDQLAAALQSHRENVAAEVAGYLEDLNGFLRLATKPVDDEKAPNDKTAPTTAPSA